MGSFLASCRVTVLPGSGNFQRQTFLKPFSSDLTLVLTLLKYTKSLQTNYRIDISNNGFRYVLTTNPSVLGHQSFWFLRRLFFFPLYMSVLWDHLQNTRTSFAIRKVQSDKKIKTGAIQHSIFFFHIE